MEVVVFQLETELADLIVFTHNALVLRVIYNLPLAAGALKRTFVLFDLRLEQVQLLVRFVECLSEQHALLFLLLLLGSLSLFLTPFFLDVLKVLNGAVVPLGPAQGTHHVLVLLFVVFETPQKTVGMDLTAASKSAVG
jgi:hypothetical protein